ncbi:hypothetical protein V8C42DRAFT_252956 [Trichoderma barbatum]
MRGLAFAPARFLVVRFGVSCQAAQLVMGLAWASYKLRARYEKRGKGTMYGQACVVERDKGQQGREVTKAADATKPARSGPDSASSSRPDKQQPRLLIATWRVTVRIF